MNILDEINERLKRIEEEMSERQAEPQKNEPSTWLQPCDIAELYKLDPKSVRKLIRIGTEAGILRVMVFSVTRGSKALVRVEPASFERFIEMGGADAVTGTEVAA